MGVVHGMPKYCIGSMFCTPLDQSNAEGSQSAVYTGVSGFTVIESLPLSVHLTPYCSRRQEDTKVIPCLSLIQTPVNNICPALFRPLDAFLTEAGPLFGRNFDWTKAIGRVVFQVRHGMASGINSSMQFTGWLLTDGRWKKTNTLPSIGLDVGYRLQTILHISISDAFRCLLSSSVGYNLSLS